MRCVPGGTHDTITTFMTTRALLNQKREDILRLAAENDMLNIRIFGSVVHGTDGSRSDVDFLVTPGHQASLLDLIGLKNALEDLLHRDVDVVSDRALSPYIRDRVLAEAEPL